MAMRAVTRIATHEKAHDVLMSEPAIGEPAMSEPDGLTLELGEGFSDDEVLVLLDGQQAWHRDRVSTNYSVGLADVVRLPSARSSTVEVRARGAAQSYRVAAAAEAGALRLRADLSPDGMLRLGPAPGGWIF